MPHPILFVTHLTLLVSQATLGVARAGGLTQFRESRFEMASVPGAHLEWIAVMEIIWNG